MPVYFDDLVFVHIPKNAGNSIIAAMESYIDKGNLPHREEYRHHESFLEIEQWHTEKYGQQKWNNTNAFSTVRNPVERAVSWWKFRKKMVQQNFDLGDEAIAFNYISSSQPFLAPWEVWQNHKKTASCEHGADPDTVDEITKLSFHEWLRKSTTWRQTGCDEVGCPLHMLAPQVSWLRNSENNIPIDKIRLFLIERMGELQKFLPDLPLIGRENVTRTKGEDYREYLTPESLRVVREYYAEDFALYDFLKRRPPQELDPLRLPKRRRKRRQKRKGKKKNASISR